VSPPRSFLADANYDAESLRTALARRDITAVIPNRRYRRTPFLFDPAAYTQRNFVERMFCRLKDWRRVATRYDKLARNYHAGLCLAAVLTCWIN
jgi:putative transposase